MTWIIFRFFKKKYIGINTFSISSNLLKLRWVLNFRLPILHYFLVFGNHLDLSKPRMRSLDPDLSEGLYLDGLRHFWSQHLAHFHHYYFPQQFHHHYYLKNQGLIHQRGHHGLHGFLHPQLLYHSLPLHWPVTWKKKYNLSAKKSWFFFSSKSCTIVNRYQKMCF